jgi:hypothetical protein
MSDKDYLSQSRQDRQENLAHSPVMENPKGAPVEQGTGEQFHHWTAKR